MKEQVEAVFSILEDVYGTSPWTVDQITSDMQNPNSAYYYVYHRHEIVGFLSFQYMLDEVEITNLAVKTAYQGRSYAKKLLANLPSHGVTCFLEVRASNHVAKQLYQMIGFKEIGRRKSYYNEPIEDAIIMRK